MKIGVVGAGYWGKNLIRVFDKLGVLKTVCDLDKKVLADIKKEYPKIETSTDIRQILTDKEIRGVVISSPASAHYELTSMILSSGKDAFVEKPLSLDVKHGMKLVEVAKKKDLILMVGHLLHYHPAVVKLKDMIKKGCFGKINYICSNRLNFGKVRHEENVLWSFASHDISIITDIMGMPKQISSVGRAYIQKNVSDIAFCMFNFTKGKAAHIFVSWIYPFKEQKLVVIGSKKEAVFDDLAKNKLVVYSHKVKLEDSGIPKAVRSKGKVAEISNKEPLMEEARHFLECVEKRIKPRTDGSSALDVLRILDACQKSMDSNQLNQLSCKKNFLSIKQRMCQMKQK